MGKPTSHPATIALDHCWVCGERFNDVPQPGSAAREEHHVIPRQAGGTDGPTVSLCASHHNLLHRIALLLGKKGREGNIYKALSGETDPEQRRKIMELATHVYNAFKAVENDPNRRFLCTISLTTQQASAIDHIKKIRGLRSREQVILFALEHLFRQSR
jgi:hypothetical protein